MIALVVWTNRAPGVNAVIQQLLSCGFLMHDRLSLLVLLIAQACKAVGILARKEIAAEFLRPRVETGADVANLADVMDDDEYLAYNLFQSLAQVPALAPFLPRRPDPFKKHS